MLTTQMTTDNTNSQTPEETPIPCVGCGRVPKLKHGEYLYGSMSHRRDCPLRVGRRGYARIESGHYHIKALQRRVAELEAERDAWREYYTAGVLLDDIDYTQPEHDAAVKRVVKAIEALTPVNEILNRELDNARQWTERESKQREAHQTDLAALRIAADEDRKLLDLMNREHLTVTWNPWHDAFVVQRCDQVCGNIGRGKTIIEALRAAYLALRPVGREGISPVE